MQVKHINDNYGTASHEKYSNPKKVYSLGRIVQIGNASRETAQKCSQPYDLIYMQPDNCIAPGGLIGDKPENFQEVRLYSGPDMIVHLIPNNGIKICPHINGPCIKENYLAAEKYCPVDTAHHVYCKALGKFIE